MKRITAVLVAVGVLLAGAPAATADNHWNYKNPAQPSKNPRDLKDSQYRGFHYEKKWEPYRKCVMARESGGNYKVDGPYGSGAFQFIQSTWDAYIDRVDPGYKGVRPHLAPPYLQEEMFWLVVNPKAKTPGLEGRHHWSASHAHGAGFTHVKDC